MSDVFFTRPVEQLLQAAFAPTPIARTAFLAWASENDFESLRWEEMRLLPMVSERLDGLEPPSALRPRLVGIAKQIWTRSHLLVAESAPAVEALANARIPTMLIKGAALYAEAMPLARRRILGDVDILVPPNDFERALEILVATGWQSSRDLSPIFLRQVARRRAGINLVQGERGEIDLHHVPLHFTRTNAALEQAVWDMARPASLAGITVLIPDAIDMLIFALGHSAGSTMGDWIVDVIARLNDPAFDWKTFALRISERGLAPLVESRLAWLEATLFLDVARAREGMRYSRSTFAERLKAYATARPKKERRLSERAVGLFADVLLRNNYSLERKEQDDVKVMRPKTRPARAPGSALANRHHISQADGITSPVTVVFRRPPLKRKIMFEIIVDKQVSSLLRGRVVPDGSEWVGWSFKLPSNHRKPTEIEIVAVPIGPLDDESPPEHVSQAHPVPFALANA